MFNKNFSLTLVEDASNDQCKFENKKTFFLLPNGEVFPLFNKHDSLCKPPEVSDLGLVCCGLIRSRGRSMADLVRAIHNNESSILENKSTYSEVPEDLCWYVLNLDQNKKSGLDLCWKERIYHVQVTGHEPNDVPWHKNAEVSLFIAWGKEYSVDFVGNRCSIAGEKTILLDFAAAIEEIMSDCHMDKSNMGQFLDWVYDFFPHHAVPVGRVLKQAAHMQAAIETWNIYGAKAAGILDGMIEFDCSDEPLKLFARNPSFAYLLDSYCLEKKDLDALAKLMTGDGAKDTAIMAKCLEQSCAAEWLTCLDPNGCLAKETRLEIRDLCHTILYTNFEDWLRIAKYLNGKYPVSLVLDYLLSMCSKYDEPGPNVLKKLRKYLDYTYYLNRRPDDEGLGLPDDLYEKTHTAHRQYEQKHYAAAIRNLDEQTNFLAPFKSDDWAFFFTLQETVARARSLGVCVSNDLHEFPSGVVIMTFKKQLCVLVDPFSATVKVLSPGKNKRLTTALERWAEKNHYKLIP